jgi:hypothetical protein
MEPHGELLDRYLQAIKTFLTGKDQDDILQELREGLLSRMEEEERFLGRSLSEHEVAAIIRANGPPFMVAVRYGPQRSLIGTNLFPYYWLALKSGLLLAFLIQAFAAVIGIVLKSDASALGSMPVTIITVFAAITFAFAVVEWAMSLTHVKAKMIDWNPHSLPKLPALHYAMKPVKRSESVAAIIFGLIGLICLRNLPDFLFTFGHPALSFAPVWPTVYRLCMVLAVAGIVRSAVLLVRPYWSGFNLWSRVAMNLAAVAVCCVLLRSGVWVSVVNGIANQPHWEALAANLNQVLYYSFLVTTVALLAMAVYDLYHFYRRHSRTKKSNGYAWRSVS